MLFNEIGSMLISKKEQSTPINMSMHLPLSFENLPVVRFSNVHIE